LGLEGLKNKTKYGLKIHKSSTGEPSIAAEFTTEP